MSEVTSLFPAIFFKKNLKRTCFGTYKIKFLLLFVVESHGLITRLAKPKVVGKWILSISRGVFHHGNQNQAIGGAPCPMYFTWAQWRGSWVAHIAGQIKKDTGVGPSLDLNWRVSINLTIITSLAKNS